MKLEFHDPKLGALFGLTDDIKNEGRYFTLTERTIKVFME